MKTKQEELFFSNLKSKLEVELSDNFDQNFWKKFDKESQAPMKAKKDNIFSIFKNLSSIQIMIPTGLVAAVLAVVVITKINLNDHLTQDFALANNIFNIAPLLEDLNSDEIELLGEVDTLDLSKEEWNILLGETS